MVPGGYSTSTTVSAIRGREIAAGRHSAFDGARDCHGDIKPVQRAMRHPADIVGIRTLRASQAEGPCTGPGCDPVSRRMS